MQIGNLNDCMFIPLLNKKWVDLILGGVLFQKERETSEVLTW